MKKIDFNTCKFADIQAVGLEDNIFVSPLAFEAYVWENACRIVADWKEAHKKVKNIPKMTSEGVEEYISNLAGQILLSFWDAKDEI